MFPAESFKDSKHPSGTTPGEEAEDEPDPPRNFTREQLSVFDGNKDEKSGADKPVYLSVNGIVFDVSRGRYVLALWFFFLARDNIHVPSLSGLIILFISPFSP